MSRYLSVLRTPGARFAFTASVLARLPISMVALGAVLLVRSERGSYALAGGLTACFALGTAVGTPWWGRLLDRRPQAHLLAPLAAVSAVLLVGFTVAVIGTAPVWLLVALCAGQGLTFPPITPAMRAAWQALLHDETDRQAAYALDAVSIEVVFIAGPLLLSLLLISTPPAVPMVVTAALLACGTFAMVASPASRRASAVVAARMERAVQVAVAGHSGHSGDPGDGAVVGAAGAAGAAGDAGDLGPVPMRRARLVAVLVIAVALAAGFGNVDVSTAATAREILGNQALLGILYLGLAGGSAAGGLWFGARVWSGSDWDRLPFSLGGLSVGLFGLAGLTQWLSSGASGALVMTLLMVLLFLAGVCIAPSVIMQQNLVDTLTPVGRRGESQSWLNASLTAGGAAGTAMAGVLIDVGGAPMSFAGAAVALALGALIAGLARPAPA